MFSVSPSRLEDRVSLVDRNINFTMDMSVRQTILFHSLMREPGTLTRGRDTKGRIDALIEDLGLSQVKTIRKRCTFNLTIEDIPFMSRTFRV